MPEYSICPNIQNAQIFKMPKYSKCPNIQNACIFKIPEYSKCSNIQNARIFKMEFVLFSLVSTLLTDEKKAQATAILYQPMNKCTPALVHRVIIYLRN